MLSCHTFSQKFFIGVISDLKIGELSSHILCSPITPNVSDNHFSNLVQIDFNETLSGGIHSSLIILMTSIHIYLGSNVSPNVD